MPRCALTDAELVARLPAVALSALDQQRNIIQPGLLGLRRLKAGLMLACALLTSHPRLVNDCLKVGLHLSLQALLATGELSTALLLHAFRALDALTSTSPGLDAFLGWTTMPPQLAVGSPSCFQAVVELLARPQSVRVVTAASVIVRRAQLYECLSQLHVAMGQVVSGEVLVGSDKQLCILKSLRSWLERMTRETPHVFETSFSQFNQPGKKTYRNRSKVSKTTLQVLFDLALILSAHHLGDMLHLFSTLWCDRCRWASCESPARGQQESSAQTPNFLAHL